MIAEIVRRLNEFVPIVESAKWKCNKIITVVRCKVKYIILYFKTTSLLIDHLSEILCGFRSREIPAQQIGSSGGIYT